MNQTEMLRQMCHEVLADADVRALCKSRGLPGPAATSRPTLEHLFLTDTGVAGSLRSLERREIALLHLLQSQEKPVDVTFFQRLDPPTDKERRYGTFSQLYQGLFTRVKDRLVRAGLLLIALGPESAHKKTKMERWQFAFPTQFARHLPPLLEATSCLTGAGDWRSEPVREKLKRAIRPEGDPDVLSDRIEIVDREFRLGGKPFRADSLVRWQKFRWQAETMPSVKAKLPDAYSLSPAEAVWHTLTGLEAGFWAAPDAMAVPVEVLCSSAVDTAAVCESGFRWGLLARQEVENRLWYRRAPAAVADALPDRYLTVTDDGVLLNMDIVPLDALETLVQLSDQQPIPLEQSRLLVTPNRVKLGRMLAASLTAGQENSLADWVQQNVPAFQQAFETVRQRRGKTILHTNLLVARVSDLSLKVALEKALGSRLVSLSDEFVAFPRGAFAEVKRIVTQMGLVIKEVVHEG